MNLHNGLRSPNDGISVEIGSWIEPHSKLLLSITFALGVDVGVKCIWFATHVSQELKVYFIVIRTL